MQEYEAFAQWHLSEKIPDWFDPDSRRRLGDAIYDFSFDPPVVRLSVHNEGNRDVI